MSLIFYGVLWRIKDSGTDFSLVGCKLVFRHVEPGVGIPVEFSLNKVKFGLCQVGYSGKQGSADNPVFLVQNTVFADDFHSIFIIPLSNQIGAPISLHFGNRIEKPGFIIPNAFQLHIGKMTFYIWTAAVDGRMGFVQNHKRTVFEGLNGNLAVFLGAQLIHIVEKIPDHRFSQNSLHPCGHDTVNDRQQHQHGDGK